VSGIRGKTAKDCFDQFTAHLNPLLRTTISKTAQVRISQLDEKGVLGWADDEFLPITTKFGKLYFWLAQSLECSHEPNQPAHQRYRLSTREYWYRLQRDNDQKSDALIRWEYMSPLHAKYKDNAGAGDTCSLRAARTSPAGR
jgi:hypothetical protein